MLVRKITPGFVTQVFDTELKRFVSQEFTAGDDVAYEDENGNAVDSDLAAAYLPFDMVQPATLKKCVRIEYDQDYWGGDYSGVGQFVHVPLSLIDRCLPLGERDPVKEQAGADSEMRLKAAFHIATGLSPVHIVHYTFDEVYDEDGNEWREEE